MNKLSVQIVGVLAFIGIALGALYYGGVFGSSQNGEASQAERTAKQVEILKYSDYSCPACAAYVPLENQLKVDFGEMVQFDYRHFPLESFPNSTLAAYAAEAARNQGKFQQMHNMLFNRQQEWSPAQANAEQIFRDYAEMLELDLEQFEADLNNEEIHAKVESNKQEGIRRQVNATPTYFVDGHKIRQNPQSYEQFKSIVELYMYRNN